MASSQSTSAPAEEKPTTETFIAIVGDRQKIFTGAAIIPGVLAFLSILVMILFQFLAGLNSFTNVEFLTNWIDNFTLMYMIASLTALVSLWITFMCIKSTPLKRKPYQFNVELLIALAQFTVIVIITLIPLTGYNYSYGNIPQYFEPATATRPAFYHYHAFIQGKDVFTIFLLCFAMTISIVANIVTTIMNTQVDIPPLPPGKDKSSGDGAPAPTVQMASNMSHHARYYAGYGQQRQGYAYGY